MAESLDLDAIQQRADNATPGPWDSNGGCEIYTTAEANTMQLWIGGTERFHDSNAGQVNADFIAHARQDVPALIARVRELEAQLAQLREKYAPRCEWCDTPAAKQTAAGWWICGPCSEKHAAWADHEIPF